MKIREDVLAGVARAYTISDMGLLRYEGWICVSMDTVIRREILDESHTTLYSTSRHHEDVPGPENFVLVVGDEG